MKKIKKEQNSLEDRLTEIKKRLDSNYENLNKLRLEMYFLVRESKGVKSNPKKKKK